MQPTSRRVALAFSLLSLVLWCTFVLTRSKPHPCRDLSNGVYTDHFSHMNAARVFPRIRTDIWRKSLASQFRLLQPAEQRLLPADVRSVARQGLRAVPGWPKDKPLVTSFAPQPRLYPPGDMLLVAPVALAYHFTNLNFTQATLALILLFLFYAHVSIYCVLRSIQSGPREPFLFPLLAFVIVYFEIIHWTLEGFYDAALFALLVVSAQLLRDRRGLLAIVAFCGATVIHFRALLFAPLALYGLWFLIRQRRWHILRRRDMAWLVVGLVLAFATLYPFWLLWPTLKALPLLNPLVAHKLAVTSAKLTVFYLCAGIAGLAFICTRAWFDLGLLGWIIFMCLRLRETYPWHALALLIWPVLAVFSNKPGRIALIRDARLLFCVAASVIVWSSVPLPYWAVHLF